METPSNKKSITWYSDHVEKICSTYGWVYLDLNGEKKTKRNLPLDVFNMAAPADIELECYF